MDKDTLIEEAKRRYPIGTTYRPLFTSGRGEYDNTCTLKDHNASGYIDSFDCVYLTMGNSGGCVYVKGKWATIVQPEETVEAIDPTENITLKKVTHVRCTRGVSSTFMLGKIYEVNENGKPIGKNNWTSSYNWDDPKRINNDFYATFEIYNPSKSSEEPQPMVENTSDLKEGDWVIGWHALCGDWRDKPWQVKEVYVGSRDEVMIRPLFHTDANYATWLNNVKKLSQQEVLDWVDKEYPIGCEYMDADVNPYENPKERTKNPRFYNINRIDTGWGYVYYDGKWAEKVEDVKPKAPTKSEDTSTISVLEHPKLGDIMVHKINNIIGRLAVSHHRDSNPFRLENARYNFGVYDHFYGICIGELSEFRDARSTEVALYLEACKNNFPFVSRGLRPTISVIDETMMYQPVAIGNAYLGTMPPISRDHRLITNSRPSMADGKEAMLKYAIDDYPIGTIILDHNGKQAVVEETPHWDHHDGSEIVVKINTFKATFIWHKINGWATIIGRTVSKDSSSVGKKNSIIDRYVKENPEDLLG